MYQPVLKDSNNYFDYTGPQLYRGHILKNPSKVSSLNINIKSQSVNRLPRQYYKDIIPEIKLKQLKITNYLYEDSPYYADNEAMNDKITSFLTKKNNQESITIKMDTLPKIMTGFETQGRKVSLFKKKNNTSIRKRKIKRKIKRTTTGGEVEKANQKQIFKKIRKKRVINKLEINDIFKDLSLS